MDLGPHRLQRIFQPTSIAIVGASEKPGRARNAIEAMTANGVELHLINRRGDAVLGQSTYTSLSALADAGVVPDVAVVFTNGAAAVEVVAEGVGLGVGGIIINAAGFAEAGAEGRALQQRLIEAAGSIPIVGPNCNGIISPSLGLHLAGSPANLPMKAGKVAFVTHSGATMLPLAIAGVERKIGFSYLVSTGNEAVVDMAEVVDFLATDTSTSAICLLIETVRNAGAFWAAVDRAIANGKPILALKNGRSARGKAIATSHTGAVAGEAWVYEAALRQHGVIVASDLVDLADRAVLFDQVPFSRWSAVRGLAIQALSGGWVTMASDVCSEEGIDLPELAELGDQIRETIPEAKVMNPLDLGGSAMIDPNVPRSAFNAVVNNEAVDSVLLLSTLAEESAQGIRNTVAAAYDYAGEKDKLIVIGSVEGGPIAAIMQEYIDRGIAVTRGLRASVRAIRAMSDFVTFAEGNKSNFKEPTLLPAPDEVIVNPHVGRILDFSATMELLRQFEIPVAPYYVFGPNDVITTDLPFAGPYVVKLADVPHRSDIGAVKLNVTTAHLERSIGELRLLANQLGEADSVVVQPMCKISSELLLGVNAESELGPVVVCGLGGIFVEVFKQVSVRVTPFGVSEAATLVEDVNRNSVLDGPRGTPAWPKQELAGILCSLSSLAQSCSPWLESLDVNPLALTDQGVVAVDGLIVLRPLSAD